MLQVLVEFQFKAVNTQQTVTIVDAIHVIGVLHAITSKITRTVRVGKRTRGQKALLKAKPNNAGPIAEQKGKILYITAVIMLPNNKSNNKKNENIYKEFAKECEEAFIQIKREKTDAKETPRKSQEGPQLRLLAIVEKVPELAFFCNEIAFL
ncbi:hypothetical protein STEG23_008842 [Scotinomys teguina]